nr:lysis system o-spanin lipoprotein Rz1 [Pantoea ananatis]
MSILGLSACASQPNVIGQCPVNPPPPAWMMMAAPDLQTPLSGIISPSESESKPSQSN